jgi:hypothetical protein
VHTGTPGWVEKKDILKLLQKEGKLGIFLHTDDKLFQARGIVTMGNLDFGQFWQMVQHSLLHPAYRKKKVKGLAINSLLKISPFVINPLKKKALIVK